MLTSLTVVSISPHTHQCSATFKSLSVRPGEEDVYKMWLGLPSVVPVTGPSGSHRLSGVPGLLCPQAGNHQRKHLSVLVNALVLIRCGQAMMGLKPGPGEQQSPDGGIRLPGQTRRRVKLGGEVGTRPWSFQMSRDTTPKPWESSALCGRGAGSGWGLRSCLGNRGAE